MRAIISGYFGFGNLGDEAIKNVIEKELTRLNIEPIFLTKSKNKENEIIRTNLFEILNEIKVSEIFISGGGGLLQDKTSSRSLYYYLSLLTIPKFFKKYSIVFAQGIGPITKNIDKKLLKSVLEKVDLITVRDNESKDLLKSIGVKKEIHVTQDLAFLYEPQIYKKFTFDEPYNVFQIKGNERFDVEELADIVRFMHYKTECETILVPFYKDVDLDIAKKVEEKTKFKVVIPENIDDVFSIFSGAQSIVGMRYHSVVFSLLLKKPVLPIFYDEKVQNISNYFEIEGIDLRDLKLSNFSRIFTKFLKEKDNFESKIKDKVIKAKEDAKRNFELLLQLIH
ncbi:polysaccharide pyruvyl transferase CsaB [Caldisericum exile]|uniref:Polysaccharide pyruvyl transferase n=1 Tax=Caldisericum exile (strain DSM 21853 / NBRC 104410 / AZM16c01) TaxID=511051 RepID=A0A7U6GEG2_CALEA|nr:polysaccharide pyruvyl transferase CsaB [Caldisericum exile]BAL80881.1 putative polysaccharide pyruvyl transferase [Caldisericum exile AZM16c01]